MRDLSKLLPLLFFSSLLVTCQHSTQPGTGGLDTTSHSFNWTFYSIGSDGDNTEFSDVTIVSDTLVYISGEMHVNDSSGQHQSSLYNVARWNGRDWTFRPIPYYVVCGQQDRTPYFTESLIAHDARHVLVLGGACEVARFADLDSAVIQCLPTTAGVIRIWGNDPNSLYAVGYLGNILHFDGVSWQSQNSGTPLELRDVSGTADGAGIFACGYSIDWGHSILLASDGQSWTTLWSTDSPANKPPFGQLVLSVWPSAKYLYVGTADGIYRATPPKWTSAEFVQPTVSFVKRIRGSADNNVAAACDNGSIWHYNGATWQNVVFGDFTSHKRFTSIAVSPSLIVAVGFDASSVLWKGWAVVGRRQ